MRTLKALVCTAALAAGLATAVAQNVYSLNVVGYYNVACPADTYVMVANQLNTTNNTLNGLFPNPVPSMQVLKWNGGWDTYTFDDIDLMWLPNGDATLNVGEAAVVKSPADTTLTFVGEVLQGALSNPLPAAEVYGARASMVPQAGLVATDLGFPSEASDQILKWNGGWDTYTYDDIDLMWLPSEPTLAVGEGVVLKKGPGSTAAAWTRNFTVE
ncbi:MAG TPA: hypothetical protein PKI20_01685 [Verrucomicrobiota bacterium]|nr:hypothetical protein [Verrucomicrobiota bacterium]HQL78368.1 hypothetical protein [Verrucomicrobiota bacterium]